MTSHKSSKHIWHLKVKYTSLAHFKVQKRFAAMLSIYLNLSHKQTTQGMRQSNE